MLARCWAASASPAAGAIVAARPRPLHQQGAAAGLQNRRAAARQPPGSRLRPFCSSRGSQQWRVAARAGDKGGEDR